MKSSVAFIIIIAVIVGGWLILRNRPAPMDEAAQNNQMNTAPTGEPLKIETLVEGTGAVAKAGDTVSVNYTGTLTDGTVFDSNVDPKFNHVQAFEFSLGAGQVIKGWDQGVVGMKIGEKRKLTIAPELAYGERAVGPIPANSVLIFEVELLSIK